MPQLIRPWYAIQFPSGLLECGILSSGGAVFNGEPENAGFVNKEAVLGLAVMLRAGRDAVSNYTAVGIGRGSR
jgi:hypothetical protein